MEALRRFGLRDPTPNREDVAENVRAMDDAGYARKTTEGVLRKQIRRFSPRGGAEVLSGRRGVGFRR